jgi:formylmethanofuran dehydrogenase subunit C
MKPLVFKCKIKDKQRLDMSWLSKIKTSNLLAIKNLSVNYGSNRYKLSTLFNISGNNFKDIIINNSNNHLDNIGNNLEDKKITIFGNVGFGLARSMISGEIILNGNAGKNACSGMRGGSVHILGNADDGFCSLPTGMNEGFIDGFIYVKKNVGNNSIIRMRRGNIIIGGDIGSGSCLELISGSVVILGKIGNMFCHNARRGTIFAKDKSICAEYIKANQTDLTFFNFYKIKVNKILDKSIINSSKPVRYFGTKSEKKLIELFII